MALGESASSALVPMRLVHQATSLGFRFADVLAVPADAPLEETRAAITGKDVVVLAAAEVAAHLARDVQDATWKEKVIISLVSH